MNGQQLKNSILQMAAQGKLVPQDPNDEPASVLLERIRKEKEKLIKEGKIKKEKNPSYIFRGADNLPYEKVGKNEPVCIADEVPFEIPKSWEWARWGAIAESIQYGFNAPAQENGKIKMVRISDIQNNNVLWERVPFCDIADTDIPIYLLRKNDILFARTGGTVGKSYLVGDVPENAVYAGYLIRTRYSNHLCPKYLKLFMESPIYWEQLKKGTTATAQPNCNGQTLSKMLIPIPPADEQHRIAEKIEALIPVLKQYDIAYQNVDNLNKTFPEELKRSILQWAVQGKLVPQDPSDEPAEVLLERIRVEKQKLIKEGKIKKDKHESTIFRRDNSHYEKLDGVERCIDDEIPFDLPESWTWVRLGYLLKVESGKSLTSKEMKPGIIPVYGGNGITGYHNKYLVDKETVVIGRVGYYCGSVYITEPKAWVTDNAFITTYPTGCIDRDYLVFTLRSMNLGQNNNATAQPVVSGKKIYPKLFPLPPLAEQKRIAIKLKEILPAKSCKM